MTILVPIMLFGWVPLTIILFISCKPHHAVLVSLIGGWLLLPQAGYNLPGLPEYNRSMAIALGLIIGGRISGHRKTSFFRWKIYDLPMIIRCLCPIASSVSNQLGFRNGIADSFSECLTWGIPYLAGRIYFNNSIKFKDFAIGILIGGILYVPLCLFEIRMSPQLSNIFYGFFPHSFVQHFRYGGWRPIVFMQHGLAVSLWMANTSVLAFWLWRSGDVRHLKSIPISIIFAALAITCVLCKSANGWTALFIGCGIYFLYSRFNSSKPVLLLLFAVPIYIGFRLTGIVTAIELENFFANFFDAERVASLGIRLYQEDLFSLKALEHPIFGWGGYDRGWPLDLVTGEKLVDMIDALWLIYFSSRGYLGIISFFCSTLIGPWLILRYGIKKSDDFSISEQTAVVLCLIVAIFMIDSLVNAMPNPIYILISGVLVSWHTRRKEKAIEIATEKTNLHLYNA